MIENNDSKLDRIFDATLGLTERVGIAGLKISDIAKEAKIASGTLYLYFKSKDELLNALYNKLQRESAPALVAEISHLPIHVQLYKMWKKALERLVLDNRRIVFLAQFAISPYISDANKKVDVEFKRYLKDLLDKGKKDHLIKNVDSDILIALIIGFVRNFSTHLVNNNEGKLSEKAIDESFSLCWDAIKE